MAWDRRPSGLLVPQREIARPSRQRGFAWLTNPYRFGAFTYDAVDFDGANDRISQGSTLDGISDSASGIVSIWVRPDTLSTVTHILSSHVDGSNPHFHTLLHNGSLARFRIQATDSGGTLLQDFGSDTAVATGSWQHFLASWSGTTRHLYINDVSDLDTNNGTGGSIPYTSMTDWWAPGHFFDTEYDGCGAEFYFAPGQYLDFSVESNRRKFRTAGGKPADMGFDGSLPTGTAPAIYLHVDEGEAADNFASNAGSGGAFTLTGALATCASKP